MARWKIAGQYMETCNCAFLCPCITSNLTAVPTEGDCKAAVALQIDKGEMDGVALDGMRFVLLLRSPGVMAAGDITAGLIVDERASDKQAQALTADSITMAGNGPCPGGLSSVPFNVNASSVLLVPLKVTDSPAEVNETIKMNSNTRRKPITVLYFIDNHLLNYEGIE